MSHFMIGPPLKYVSSTSVNFIYLRSKTGCFVLYRLKLEVLTDKEPGELEVNTEEEEDKGQQEVEEGLLSSQPQPSTSQILLEEEDLIIEQYDSD